MSIATIVGHTLISVGALLIAAAAVGMIRLLDTYNRTNAVAKGATLGVLCVVLGTMVLIPSPTVIVTGALAIAAQLFTAPIAGYAVGRAAYRSGVPLTPRTHRDDLADRSSR